MEIKKIPVGMLRTNCYLLIDDGELAVIDPGDEAQKIINEIEKTGAKPKFIVNTHNHFDHIGANGEISEKYGIEVLKNFKEGNILAIGKSNLEIIKTPGHTPDGICLIEDDFIISGDTLFSDGFGRTDLPGGSNKEMAASLSKLDQIIGEGTAVYPGHGDIFKYKKGMALEFANCLEI